MCTSFFFHLLTLLMHFFVTYQSLFSRLILVLHHVSQMEYFSLNRWWASYSRMCLKTLLLVEVINGPDGAMPGGLDNVRESGWC